MAGWRKPSSSHRLRGECESPEGLVCMGGNDADEVFDDVFSSGGIPTPQALRPKPFLTASALCAWTGSPHRPDYLSGRWTRWPDTGDCHRSVMVPGPVATRKRFRLPVEDSPTHSRRGACLQPHLGSAQRISGQSLCSERKDSRPGRGAFSGRLLGIPADELHLAAAQGSSKVCHGRKRRALGAKSLAGSGGSRRSAVSSGRCVEG